jgi:GNAT superfamily N-acetyltransferase
MWRPSRPDEDDAIVRMCLSLYAEDPGDPVGEDQIRRTLAAFRAEPARGRALVAEQDGALVGYALLAAFWSNECGGEIVVIDELWVAPSHRGRGISTSVLTQIGVDPSLWPGQPVALELETTPDNENARRLYERVGFKLKNRTMRRFLPPAGRRAP